MFYDKKSTDYLFTYVFTDQLKHGHSCMTGSSEQLLSADCWRASLKVLGCSAARKNKVSKTSSTHSVCLSPQQVIF